MNVPVSKYSERIKHFRKILGLTQEALAEKLGVAFATVNRWENNQTRPSGLSWNQLQQLEQKLCSSPPFKLPISKIVVLITSGTDKVYIHTNLPSPFPVSVDSGPLTLQFDTTKGKGVEYVQNHFGIDPEIIDTNAKPERRKNG